MNKVTLGNVNDGNGRVLRGRGGGGVIWIRFAPCNLSKFREGGGVNPCYKVKQQINRLVV